MYRINTDETMVQWLCALVSESICRCVNVSMSHTGYRIQEAYAKAGKEIAYYIWKSYLK